MRIPNLIIAIVLLLAMGCNDDGKKLPKKPVKITGVNFLGATAKVSLTAPEETFENPPSVTLRDGQTLDLYTKYNDYDFAGDRIKLRSYALSADGGFDLPISTTIRVPKSGHYGLNVINDLPEDANRYYWFYMANNEGNIDLLNQGAVSEPLDSELQVLWSKELARRGGNSKWLDSLPKDLLGAKIDAIEQNSLWEVIADGDTLIFEKTYNVLQADTALFVYKRFDIGGNHNIPHNFNTTNMHTHGWHVSPAQDNIFLKVLPENDTLYAYDIEDHQAGTFWYHPHVHGATGIQVASGMAGALIVDEDPEVLKNYPALAAASDSIHEKVMLFDQLTYDPLTGEVNDFKVMMWVGLNSDYSSGVHGTTINGKVRPVLKMYPGEVQRWRMIHKGFRTSLAMDFPEDKLEVLRIAVDGIMFDAPQSIGSIHMAPGNRVDVLVKAKTNLATGTRIGVKSTGYDPECEYFTGDDKCNAYYSDTLQSLLTVEIAGSGDEMNIPTDLPPRAPELIKDVSEDELMGQRETDFLIATKDGRTQFMVNGEEFAHNRVNETLLLDSADQWRIKGGMQGHPYHIHINPFQVWNFNGRDLDKPMWKDVAYIKDTVDGAYLRSRYVNFVGDFVLHCHILDHEDQGMMQFIRISPNLTDSVTAGLGPLTYPKGN